MNASPFHTHHTNSKIDPYPLLITFRSYMHKTDRVRHPYSHFGVWSVLITYISTVGCTDDKVIGTDLICSLNLPKEKLSTKN